MTTQNEREIDAACHCPIVFVVNFPVFVTCLLSRLYFYDYKENKEPSSVKIVLVSHYTAKCRSWRDLGEMSVKILHGNLLRLVIAKINDKTLKWAVI